MREPTARTAALAAGWVVTFGITLAVLAVLLPVAPGHVSVNSSTPPTPPTDELLRERLQDSFALTDAETTCAVEGIEADGSLADLFWDADDLDRLEVLEIVSACVRSVLAPGTTLGTPGSRAP